MSSLTKEIRINVPNYTLYDLVFNPFKLIEIIFTDPLQLVNIFVYSITKIKISKILLICFVLFGLIFYKFPGINYKQNFIMNKFYIFFTVFLTAIVYDFLDKDYNGNESIQLSTFISIIVVLTYSFYTDLVINGFTDNFENQLRKILFFIFLILVVLCSMNIIKNFISAK